MTAIPVERRLPSLKLALCAAAIPLAIFMLPIMQAVLPLPSMVAQYWGWVSIVVVQWLAYLCGIINIGRLLGRCPPAATTAGAVFTVLASYLFIGLGVICCGFFSFILWIIMTFGID